MVKNLPVSAGDSKDTGSIPGSGRSPGEGNGNPLQCSCLKNLMDRWAWQATVHGVSKSCTWLSDWAHTHTHTHIHTIWICYKYWNIYIKILDCLIKKITAIKRRPHGLYPARLLCPWDFPGHNTGVGRHSLLQEIFPTQGSNPGVPDCRWILYHLSHQRSPVKNWYIKIKTKAKRSLRRWNRFLKIAEWTP